MANSNLITLFLLLIISYTILYFRGRKYLEHFNDKRFNPDGSPNENMVKAYVLIKNNWVSGYVFISNGYVTRVQFDDITDGYRVIVRAQLYQKVPVSYLNPNNPIAINNNFTCFIDIPNYGRAYFTI